MKYGGFYCQEKCIGSTFSPLVKIIFGKKIE